MTAPTENHAPLPSPEAFRLWLTTALALTEQSAYSIGPRLGLGHNTVAMFLKNQKADIRLGTAKGLHDELQNLAAKGGFTLAPIAGLADG